MRDPAQQHWPVHGRLARTNTDRELYHDKTEGQTVVVVDAKVDPADGLLDVGVVEDNVGRLAAELERDLLQVGRRGGLHDRAADESGAGEGDLVDVHVRGEGGAGGLAE